MALETNYLKKLKIKLLFSILIVCCFVYCYLNSFQKSKYDIKESEFIIKVTKINYKDDRVVIEGKGKEKLLINYKGDFKYELGDKIIVHGVLNEPSVNTNFNLFNYKKYLLSKKIYYILNAEEVKLLEKNKNIFYKIKNKIINKLNGNVYLNGFILGDNSYIDEEVKKSYQLNGISHLFSVSGMHVGFIVLILTAALKKFKWYQIILILGLLFYSFLTNFLPSIMRSVIFFSLCLIKKKRKWNISTFCLFMIMTMFFLFYNPFYIYNIGFIYSFVISGSLIHFSDKLKEKNYFKSLFKISFFSFLFSFPITTYNNFSINFLSPILNLFFVPFVSLIIFPLSFIVLFLSFLNPLFLFLTNILEQISLFCSKITVFNLTFAKPSILFLLVYYIIIVFSIKNKKGLVILFIFVVVHCNIHFFKMSPVVTMLDVGQGDSLLLELPFNKGNVLIDTGGKLFDDSNNISGNIIIPYLKSIGINKIDYLIITHGDYDHMGESINLVENFKIDKVIFNCGDYNNLENKLIDVLDNKKIRYYSCVKELNLNKYKLKFLSTKEYDNENDNSNVIYTELNGYKLLLMGDAGTAKEKDILEKYNLTNIDFFKVGHHGSNTSSSEDFINRINPKYSLISVGKNNRYGHPKETVLSILHNSKVYRTDLDGSIKIKLNNNGCKIKNCDS